MSSEAAAALARGLDHHRAGRPAAAIGEYAACLALDPDNVDALNLRGLAEHQCGDNAAALRLLARAVELQPLFAGALQHLAEVQNAMGDLDAAEASFTKLAGIAPAWHGGPYGLGQILELRGDAAGAARAYEAALAAKPDFAPAHFALANVRAAQGDLAAGLAHMRAAVAAAPDVPENHNGLASMLLAAGDVAGAEAGYRACLAHAPGHPGGLYGLGMLLVGQSRLAEAQAIADGFLAALPVHPEAYLLQGEVARLQSDTTTALKALSAAFFAMAGETPVETNRPQAAFAAIRALAQRLRAASAPLRPARIERLATVAGLLAVHVAAFGDFATGRELLDTASALGGKDAARTRAVLALYDPDLGTDDLARIHRAFADSIRANAHVPAGVAAPAVRASSAGRLRVGYLSSEFRNHPVARSLRPLFECRDRERFEVHGYCLTGARDATRDLFVASADGWRDLAGRPDADIAAAVRADGIDILVHVAGHFDQNRLGVALHRPARVHASLFDSATSGLPEIDCLFADATQAPRGGREWFAERVVRLPNLYLHEPIADAPAVLARDPDAPVAFAAFCNPVKINDAVLAAWRRVLARVPGSTLVLGHHRAFEDPAMHARIVAGLAGDGVDPARVFFRRAIADPAAHLSAYAGIDVALDTFPFNGSTSTFEALWMGVPVVTLAGGTVMSRWAAAMLRPLGLAGLAATDIDSYVELAADLARDRQRLAALRATLRGRLSASSLCNTVRWTRRIERVYRTLVPQGSIFFNFREPTVSVPR